uniref:Uncharacterized protein n=1 Tax=Oryzias melastigma TaxID=30732 RepID=A0A3B3CRR2_ORYME
MVKERNFHHFLSRLLMEQLCLNCVCASFYQSKNEAFIPSVVCDADVDPWVAASSHLLLTAGLVSQDAVHLCYDRHGELWKDLWAERSADQQGQMETRKV